MNISREKATHGKSRSAARRPGSGDTAGPSWAQQRLQRIDALLGVGVEMNSALIIELIRSMTVSPVDKDALNLLFDRAAEADSQAEEVSGARKAAERADYPAAIAKLQSYLHRTLVDEVPIADRRLRRSPRFTREPGETSAPTIR